jgi:hypothetical protein
VDRVVEKPLHGGVVTTGDRIGQQAGGVGLGRAGRSPARGGRIVAVAPLPEEHGLEREVEDIVVGGVLHQARAQGFADLGPAAEVDVGERADRVDGLAGRHGQPADAQPPGQGEHRAEHGGR